MNNPSADDHADEQVSPRTKGLRLDHFLKQAGVVVTGGQGKLLIQAGEVCVNGQVETRRRCQLHPGDTVQVGEIELIVGA